MNSQSLPMTNLEKITITAKRPGKGSISCQLKNQKNNKKIDSFRFNLIVVGDKPLKEPKKRRNGRRSMKHKVKFDISRFLKT